MSCAIENRGNSDILKTRPRIRARASVVKWISRQASNLKMGVRVPPEVRSGYEGSE